MATFTVTTLNDTINANDGVLSVREAVAQSNATASVDTIQFASTIEGQTLLLSGGELVISRDVNIDGDLNNDGQEVTLSGGLHFADGGEALGNRVLNIVGGETNVDARDLTIADGCSHEANGGAILLGGGVLTLASCTIRDSANANSNDNPFFGGAGGAIYASAGSLLTIVDSVIRHNQAGDGSGAIFASDNSTTSIINSTVAENGGAYQPGRSISTLGDLYLSNATVTNNYGGGISASDVLRIENSIVAGNFRSDIDQGLIKTDIIGSITTSDGHNVFGTNVIGNIAGDVEGAAGSAIFASVDTYSGGGLVNADGIVPLRNNVTNPALGGALSFDSLATDQLGRARPQSANSQPDIGAAELNQTLSTTPSNNNDVLTDNNSAHTVSGGLGNDRIYGQGGNDTLNGNDGSDTFDGGAGNDRINGGTGVDVALYSGSTAVVFDLSGTTDRATQGSAVDTLTGVEGGAGGSGADTFRGDAGNNYFRGGDGKDTATGGGGRDTYYYTNAQNSPATTGRDVITDFVHGQDKINLARIDPDSAHAGDQAFHWLGRAALGTTPGDLSWFSSGGNTIVQGNTDTDTAAEFWIQLNGNVGPSLTAADFIL